MGIGVSREKVRFRLVKGHQQKTRLKRHVFIISKYVLFNNQIDELERPTINKSAVGDAKFG